MSYKIWLIHNTSVKQNQTAVIYRTILLKLRRQIGKSEIP